MDKYLYREEVTTRDNKFDSYIQSPTVRFNTINIVIPRVRNEANLGPGI
jgi:hypothetical protein